MGFALDSSCGAICPSACWFDTSGEIGVGLFWRPLGIPLAEARLLAIEDDRSRALGLKPRGSRGGCPAVSGDGGLSDSVVGGEGGVAGTAALVSSVEPCATSAAAFSCFVRSNRPSFLCSCSNRFRIRTASESEDPWAALAYSAAARSCSSLAATGFDRLNSEAALRAWVCACVGRLASRAHFVVIWGAAYESQRCRLHLRLGRLGKREQATEEERDDLGRGTRDRKPLPTTPVAM
jgi:hypothetical protein